MIGSGVDMILDTMAMNNMFKKLDKGKGIVMGLSKQEIDENKIEGTGLFESGNKSGKISRTKKAYKWKDFANETSRDGIDLASYRYTEYQKAKNSIGSKVKYWFGGGDMEMDGGNVFTNAQKSYNKNIQNSKLGSALRKSTGNILGDVYDKGENELGKHKYTKPISEYMREIVKKEM
jgi:hypothetical protein